MSPPTAPKTPRMALARHMPSFLLCAAMLVISGCASPLEGPPETPSNSSPTTTAPTAPSPHSYPLKGCPRAAGQATPLVNETRSWNTESADPEGASVNESALRSRRQVDFLLSAGPDGPPAPVQYLRVAEEGIVLKNSSSGSRLIEAHVEWHITDAYLNERQNPQLEVWLNQTFEPGPYRLDICLQKTGGIQRSVLSTRHLYVNFTVS